MPRAELTPAQQALYDSIQSSGESIIPNRGQTRESSRARSAWIRTAKSLRKKNLIALQQVGVDTWKASRL